MISNNLTGFVTFFFFLFQNERVIDYNCTLTSPSLPVAKSSPENCYSKTVSFNTGEYQSIL